MSSKVAWATYLQKNVRRKEGRWGKRKRGEERKKGRKVRRRKGGRERGKKKGLETYIQRQRNFLA